MNYGKYPKYYHSKNQWLNKLPQSWGIIKLKFLAYVKSSNVDKKTIEDEVPINLCNYVDVFKNDYIDNSFDFMEASASENEISKFSLYKDDVIITKDSETPDEIAIPAYIVEDLRDTICGYHLAYIKTKKEFLLGSYLFRLFQAKNFNSQFTVSANGITRFGLDVYSIKNAFISIPSIEEQHSIAAFLDYKTSQIDELIERKEELLKLLEEKRIALITQAVTKGIKPNVKMKPSGIDWLGDIPEHWEVKRLRFLAKINPSKSEVDLSNEDYVSFIPMDAVGEYGGINLDETRFLDDVYNGYTYFKDGDVLIAKITPCFENGKGALAENLANTVGFGTTELHIVRASNILSNKYIQYLTFAHHFRNMGASEMLGAGGQKRVPENFMKDFLVAYPDLQEQKNIVNTLETKLFNIDKLIICVTKATEKLKEYRTSLITAAVTGKIRVPTGDVKDYKTYNS